MEGDTRTTCRRAGAADSVGAEGSTLHLSADGEGHRGAVGASEDGVEAGWHRLWRRERLHLTILFVEYSRGVLGGRIGGGGSVAGDV